MTNYSRVKAAQKRAKKIIEKQNRLGWEVKQSIIDRANAEVPKNISAKKAQAMVDNLSAYTIRILSKISDTINTEEADPIVKGNYKSGAKIYDVVHMNPAKVKSSNVTFTERNVVDKVMGQIEFVMNNAPNRDVAKMIESRLNAIELYGSKIFNTNDVTTRRAGILQSIESKKAIEKSVKAAEAKGYPATQALVSLYGELVSEYGTNERGLAARQLRQFQDVLEKVGYDYSTDEGERQIAADVLRWLIENADIWDSYRTLFKLKKIYKEVYDSNSLITDVSDSIVEHPQYRMKILNYLIELMEANTEPWNILDKIDDYVKELKENENN